MATREEIEAQIEALQAEAAAMDDGDDYDVEIWNEKGEGARLPSGKTTRWLKEKFPELFDPDPEPDANSDADNDGKSGSAKRGGKPARSVPASNSGTRTSSTATKYFGKRPAGK